MLLRQPFERPDNIKTMHNIGACMDIPTGYPVIGKDGRTLWVGGLGPVAVVVGRGNRFKSTTLHYMLLAAMDRIFSTVETSASLYDTEINIFEDALERFISCFKYLAKLDIIRSGIWNLTDKTKYYGNKFFERLKEFLDFKTENAKSVTYSTPFFDRDRQTLLRKLVTTFSTIDSFTEFDTESTIKTMDENELGASGGNTIHMRAILDKTRFLMEIPTLFGNTNHFLLMTAHLGEAVEVGKNPYAPVLDKKLQHLKQGEKIKGVGDKINFLTTHMWYASHASKLINSTTKGPEFPSDKNDNNPGDLDLNLVSMQMLRSKTGPSGWDVDLVVSQREGVKPGLTEYWNIKSHEKFGIGGNNTTFYLELKPETKMMRTTIRSLLEEDEKLARAMTITSELCQLYKFHRGMDDLCSAKELYDDLKAMGYDWDVLLRARGWWTFEDDEHPIPYLHTCDLLRMRAGKYHPYWMDENKQVLPKYKAAFN